MFAADRAPRYVEETAIMAARLQEQTTPAQYEALAARASRLVAGLFSLDTGVPFEIQVKIALREKFDPARTKQAVLMVATWQLIEHFSTAKSLRAAPAAVRHPRPAVPAPVLALAAR